ncbi:MAG: SPOR domain-containing protein [Rickettsiales bacterium]|nr:SPOR domain-containing protein [Rickettsiales bacterium]
MKQFLGKSFILFLSLIFASCAAKNEQQPRIRIVDLDGNSHSVVTKIPELNKQAMSSQGVLKEQPAMFENNLPQETAQNSAPQMAPDYGVLATPVAPQKPAQQEPVVGAGKQDETVEYDLSSPEEDAKPEVKPTKKLAKTAAEKGLFVQVGSFENSENATKTLAKMEKFHKGRVETVEGEKPIYRVILGPFKSKPKALALMKKIKASGSDAVLMRSK